MRRPLLIAALLLLMLPISALAQAGKGILTGTVKDTAGAVLQGAKIDLQPQVRPIGTDGQGQFTITDVEPGSYTITISYVGFAPYTAQIAVTAGQTARVDATLKVQSASDDVVVTADRVFGEAEAVNRTLAAENILQVLPAEVIVSLPNANIADALGRMASVTIERDEGEGKYVQIRGTEPRLSNTMIDGVTVPSPESGVRQIKLDTIASDLVDSVEINKTLQANIDADGIGGSVNLVTKTAGDEPNIVLYGIGGYTPIQNGRNVEQTGGTIGRRFGASKKLGVLVGGTYDYNGRGINDVEPSPTANDATPHYSGMDFRDYVYDRTRWGASGSVDYKLKEGSDISLRTLFSTFRNWGHKWVYTMNDGGAPGYGQDWRRPNMAVGSMALQGKHLLSNSTILWGVSVSRSRSLGGSGGANYQWMGDSNAMCKNVPGVSVYRPGWTGCIGPNVAAADNAFDRNNYGLIEFDPPTFGQSVQLNLQASASYARMYHIGTHFGTFELGGKIRNAHKFDNTYNEAYLVPACDGTTVTSQCPKGTPAGTPIPIANSLHPEWNGDFTDSDYYNKTWGKYPAVTDWGKVKGWVLQNSGQIPLTGGPGVNSHNYDLIERIPAGYLMNTVELASRVRLVTGVRFEATHVDTRSFDGSVTPAPKTLTYKAGGDYLDVLPSASLRFAVDKDSDLRLVFGRGLARPNPQDLSKAVGQPDKTQTPPTVDLGNPNLKAEHGNNYDILYERSFSNVGLIQAGYFYKDLTDPITTIITYPKTGPFAGYKVTQPGNAGSAHVQGIEIGFQQRLSYLPSVLRYSGISANYSYTTSQAKGLPGRSDSPALLRQAPNSWNISPTFDTRHFSMRVGMSFDDKMIYAYQWTDGADSVGIHGPSGDNYLYSHFQFDTQASYRLPGGFEVYAYGLNLNNEVFGFYNGSKQYVVQREYYHPTYAGGLRWNLHHE